MSPPQVIVDGHAQGTSLRQLRAFVAVYRLGKLSAAAERLSVTQSAVSLLVKDMEDRLGVKLFDRTTRNLEPTQTAHEVIPFAERVLQDLSRFDAVVREVGTFRRGRVSLAATPATGMALLPTAVRRFVQAYPDVRVTVDDCAPGEFVSRIESELVEFGIGTPDIQSGGLEVRPLINDRLGIVCRKDHPFASRGEVAWADLHNEPLIAIAAGYGIRRMAEAAAAGAGVELRVVNEVHYLTSVLWMVDSGLGVAIFPCALAVLSITNDIVVRPLVAPVVTRDTSIVTKAGRSLSPACVCFIGLLVEVLRERGLEGLMSQSGLSSPVENQK